MATPFTPLAPQLDLPTVEHEILDHWERESTFASTISASAGRPQWTFFEGPPTTNGMPGTHHLEARAFKDVFCRYKTMRGYYVPRRAGWDCHGLPVEIAVEQELGFSGKGDIERYGIAEFNAKCRESVGRHVAAFEDVTRRLGYWVDMSTAYRTMDPDYIESVWWSLATIFDKGLLVQDHRVAPWCPRCGTGLSDHELAQGYETVVDPSVFVAAKVLDGPLTELDAHLLVWTTTPWTLISNTAVAVHPDATYVAARAADGNVYVVAEPLLAKALGEDAEVLRRMPGRDLEHTHYQRMFDLVEIPDAHYVVLADYVTMEDGSGLVHQAPAFGADDLAVARRYGLPVVNPIRPDGTFTPELPLVGGMFFKTADPILVDDLKARGLLVRYEPYEHSYPHCWRCHTTLIYYAQPSWYIRTTAIKAQLEEQNELTNWFPATIKHGRYGDWLANNIDWALSRNRYWGTPLPIWRCADDPAHLVAISSLADLAERSGQDLAGLDPHRPYVDAVTFSCPQCGGQMSRVPEVIDCWYDSGSMPFGQLGYPRHNVEEFEASYPAQFICEAIDQTRGWFYTMMAIGTLVFGRSSYENVLCLGHIVDADGRKMSKHLGNVLEPMELMDRHGADAVRWFLLCSGSPWSSRRVGHDIIDEAVRRILLTYWNTAAFFTLYASANDWSPSDADPAPDARPALDRWLLEETDRLVEAVTEAMDEFDTARAGRALTQFIDDLSNWYVRCSRRRFWNGDPAALATLHEVLAVLTRLLAPFVPFLTERIWDSCVRAADPSAPASVHLASWPEVRLTEAKLGPAMALVRRVVDLGRSARAESGVKIRQPLARMSVSAAGFHTLSDELKAIITGELNLADVVSLSDAHEVVDSVVKPNFRALGKRFGKVTAKVAAAIGQTDAAKLVAALRNGAATVEVEGEPAEITADDVIVSETPKEGWTVAAAGGDTVALDTTITPELRRAGMVRDVVRLVQEARKASGFDVSDRITLWWKAGGELAEAINEGAATIAEEVLAVTVEQVTNGHTPGPAEQRDEALGLSFWINRLDTGTGKLNRN